MNLLRRKLSGNKSSKLPKPKLVMNPPKLVMNPYVVTENANTLECGLSANIHPHNTYDWVHEAIRGLVRSSDPFLEIIRPIFESVYTRFKL